MAALPSGTVTFLFTDLEGSTRLWEQHPEAMRDALARHDAIVRDAIESHHGHVVKTTGDGAHAAFATASDAVDAAVAAQVALAAEIWTATGPLLVRMGIHTGEAELRAGDYYGTALNRAARIMSVAHGGQVVVSLTTSDLLRDAPVELLDLGDHRLRDLGEPERIFQVVHPDLRQAFPALRSVENFPTNLPLQTTSFVGREDDMAEVIAAFDHSRLVTLTGVGGVGKTRLAIQVGAELLPQYPDGAWLCELGPLGDAEAVPDVVAAAVTVRQRPGMSMSASIADSLGAKRVLIVLDNCEHVIGAAAQLANAVLQACPGVRILATSREGLGVRGEQMIAVRSLDLPEHDGTLDELASTEAVRLFVDRAREAGSMFHLDEVNRLPVAQLTRRLDGIPLAIELAAARMRMMTPAEIADRLDERFRLLTGGSRTAVERHQTLRHAVDWSYDLLEPRERTVLNRIGVFAGGFTLDAAESVAEDSDLEAFDLLDAIGQLIDKSLVVADETPLGTRYRLLETIRQYALERLDEEGATDTVRRRHAEWCAGFADASAQLMVGPDERTWRDRLDREIDNLRSAITWAVDRDDTDLAMRLMGGVPFFALMFREASYRLAPLAPAVLRTSGALEHPKCSRVLAMRSLDHQSHGRYEDAELDARLAIERMADPDVEQSMDAWGALWTMLIFSGRAEELLPVHDEILRVGRNGGDTELFVSRNLVVGSLYACDRAEEGLALAERNVDLARRMESSAFLALAVFALGGAVADREPERARELFRESVRHGRDAGIEFMTSMALARLARMDASSLDREWARDFRAGVDVAWEAGDPRTMGALFDLFSAALTVNDRAEAAARLFGYVMAWSPSVGNPTHKTASDGRRASLTSQLGEHRFDALLIEGAAMSAEDAVRLVRAELDRVITA